MTDNAKKRFKRLRNAYMLKRDRLWVVEHELRASYALPYEARWLTRPQQRRLDAARTAMSRAGDALYAHLAEISPRDWSYGVPCTWLYEQLTYDDAVRSGPWKSNLALCHHYRMALLLTGPNAAQVECKLT